MGQGVVVRDLLDGENLTVNHNVESWREQAHGYPRCGFIA